MNKLHFPFRMLKRCRVGYSFPKPNNKHLEKEYWNLGEGGAGMLGNGNGLMIFDHFHFPINTTLRGRIYKKKIQIIAMKLNVVFSDYLSRCISLNKGVLLLTY